MKAVDTSVAVAAFGEWHVLNEPARRLLDQGTVIPAHALLETYSVLTGFPPPHRAPTEIVATWLDERFGDVLPPPAVDDHRALIQKLARAGRAGGVIYEALVGLTAKLAGAVLVTADQRALGVYDVVGVDRELLG